MSITGTQDPTNARGHSRTGLTASPTKSSPLPPHFPVPSGPLGNSVLRDTALQALLAPEGLQGTAPPSPREATATSQATAREGEGWSGVGKEHPSAPRPRANPTPGTRPAHPTSVKLLLVIRTAPFLPRGGPHAMGSGHEPPQTLQDVSQPSALTSCWTSWWPDYWAAAKTRLMPTSGCQPMLHWGPLHPGFQSAHLFAPLAAAAEPGSPRWHRQEEPGAWQREGRFRQGHMG